MCLHGDYGNLDCLAKTAPDTPCPVHTHLAVPRPQSSMRGEGDAYKIYFILVHHSTSKVQISCDNSIKMWLYKHRAFEFFGEISAV